MKLSTRLPIGVTLSDFASVRTCDEHSKTAASLIAELLDRVGPVELRTALPGRRTPNRFRKAGAVNAFPEVGRNLILELLELARQRKPTGTP